ncbi:MAG: hypothetical protein CMF25_03650, partial [Kangiellaceae bacterium]|nr:hypothetical protein [Kangiellaceae bacterium]
TGELWYTDYANNHVYRIYNPNIDSNEIPVIAAFDASTLKGASPLSVTFDASGSSGEDMQITWDLDGDGQFDDGNTLATQATYTTAGLHKVSLRVEDVNGQTDVKTIMLQVASADNGVDITIHQPDPGMHWAADDIVTLDGTAVLSGTDTPAANMAWDAGINHCDRTDPTDCHSHPLGSDIADPFANTTSLLAPQHEMPTSIELSLCADGQPFAADWWNASWNKRRFIFVNNSQQNEGLTDFPALVKLDGSRIDYSVAGANGQSLRFVDAQGQLLAHEIESWDPNGESVVWVKINAISASTVNDYIVMYYDNPAASSPQNSGAVWSNNFAGVWHLNQLNDSTTNGNNGANNGSDSLQGAIGLGRHFNGTDEFIGIPHSNSLALANQLTVEAWIKADNPIDQMFGRFISKKSDFAGTDGFELQFHPATDYVSVIGSGNANLVKGEGAVDGETWNYISTTINGANATLYVNGEAVSTGPIDPVVANNIPLNIGRAGADQNYFRGLIDEVRLSSSVRSAAWVAAQHLSMSDQLLQFSLEDTRAPVRFCKFIDEIHPQITTVRVRSNPAGLPALGLDSDAFDQDDITHEVIVNSPTSIFANPQLTNNGQLAQFRCWQEEILASGQVEEFDCNNDIPDIVPVTPLSFIADYNVSDIPESNFPSLSLRGTFNGWGTLPMTLVADNLWRVNATFTGAGDGNGGDRLKFDVLGDWVQNYGDNIPANGIADPVGDDIPVTEDGEYVIEFNDQTFAYSITPAITGPQPPVANAGADISVAPGTTVTFDGSGSNDPNGVISTYEWNSTAFPQTLTGQSPSFTFADEGVFTIVLTVTDNEGLDDNDTLVVTVEPQPLQSQFDTMFIRGTMNSANGCGGWGTTAMALVADFTWMVEFSFDGRCASHEMKFDASGLWTAGQNWGDDLADGIADLGGDNILLDPNHNDFRVTFNTQTRVYSVEAINLVATPVVNAGADQNVTTDQQDIVLNGSATDADGTIVSTEWTQVSGPQSVFLTNSDQLSASYPTPMAGTYVFKLTAIDNDGNSGEDTITVTITEPGLQSQFDTMFIRGTMNSANGCGGWGTTAMTLVADFTWMVEFSFDARCASHELKFDASGLWTAGQNWGDDLADGTADLGGDNIVLDPNHNDYRVTFNTQTLVYTVEALNQVAGPVVDAGDNVVATTDQQDIVLNGSASDADGTIVSIEWNQLSGPQSIFLTNSDQLSASYPTPMAGTYVFELTVTDNDGNSASDTVTVTVGEPTLQSTFDSMFIRGTMNSANGCGGWGTTAMALVEDFTWELEFSFDGRCASHELKFDASGLWTAGQNWGDNEGDGIADAGGDNIVLNPNHNTFLVRFNDQTKEYVIIER